jgi:hypothetical protein
VGVIIPQFPRKEREKRFFPLSGGRVGSRTPEKWGFRGKAPVGGLGGKKDLKVLTTRGNFFTI